MTESIKKVVEKIKTLPESVQEDIAKLIQDELAWHQVSKSESTKLHELANDAIKEFENGEAVESDW